MILVVKKPRMGTCVVTYLVLRLRRHELRMNSRKCPSQVVLYGGSAKSTPCSSVLLAQALFFGRADRALRGTQAHNRRIIFIFTGKTWASYPP